MPRMRAFGGEAEGFSRRAGDEDWDLRFAIEFNGRTMPEPHPNRDDNLQNHDNSPRSIRQDLLSIWPHQTR